jgi:hypothetical protein
MDDVGILPGHAYRYIVDQHVAAKAAELRGEDPDRARRADGGELAPVLREDAVGAAAVPFDAGRSTEAPRDAPAVQFLTLSPGGADMNKIRLNAEALRVESFEPAPDAAAGRGTVRGHRPENSCDTNCDILTCGGGDTCDCGTGPSDREETALADG